MAEQLPGEVGPQAGDAKSIYEIAREDGNFSPEAFEFVQEGLNHALGKLNKPRHVSGPELCAGLCELARQRYGLLARTVLGGWRITCTEDFGRIVFAMVAAGVMSKCDEDELSDFVDVFDFEDVFDRDFAIELRD